jgi:multidrug efflux system outer membrane protein
MFLRALVASTAVLATVLLAPVAAAQPATPETPAAPAADLVQPTAPPAVSDPMLEPPRGDVVKIGSWDEALARVRARSPEYRSDFQAIKRAEAQTRIALAALLPVVTGQGAYTHSFNQLSFPFGGATIVTPPVDALTVGATASWTPLNLRAIYDYQTSQKAVDVEKLAFDDQRRQIATSVVSAMLATLSAERVAELNRVGLRAALERLQLTQSRLAFGQGTLLDEDRAAKDVDAARRLIVDGDESLRRAREALGVALGSPQPVAVSPSLDLEDFERAVAGTCRLNEDVERRPDVAAARSRVQIAHRAAVSAELAPLPTLGAQGQAGYNSSPVLLPGSTGSVGLVLTVPFYDGGVRYGQLRDARAAEEQARANLQATRLAAIVSAAQAKRSVEVSRVDRDVSKSQRDYAARIDVRTRDAYAHGKGTSLDLVTSAQDLRTAEIDLAILDFQHAEARAAAVLENAECTY